MTTRLHRQIATTTIDIAYLASCIAEVEAELHTKLAGLKGVTYDGPGATSNGHSDPTAQVALTPDPARHDLDRLTRAINQLATIAHTAATIASNHRTPDPAKLRRNLQTLTANGDPGCELHARIGVWAVVYRTGTVAGRLNEKTKLCRACYDFVGINDRPPSKRELNTAKRTGKRLRPAASPVKQRAAS